MTQLRNSLTAVMTLIVTAGLLITSFSPAETGYEFPQAVAIFITAMAAVLVILTLIPKGQVITDSGEPLLWGSIWPTLVILIAFLLIAEWLGFFATSFIAFYSIVTIYSPEALNLRSRVKIGIISAIFMGVLYLIFVSLLNVQVPSGILI